MKINKFVLTGFLAVYLIILNLLSIYDVNYLYVRSILSFVFFVIVPGHFILNILRVRVNSIVEYIAYSLGLSLSVLMLGGLFINTFLPNLGINNPLSDWYIHSFFSGLVTVLGFISLMWGKKVLCRISKPMISMTSWYLLIASGIFPILSIGGAMILNNGGTNSIAFALIIGIALFTIVLPLFRNKTDESIYPLVIFNISISLLLSYTLRSWHVLGWDINQEYLMFELTKEKELWAIANAQSVYNSCLSVTIFPTILHSFTKINDEYIFKVIFQLLFAVVPINVYLIVRRYMGSLLSFYASFFFIAQQAFYMQLPSVARQEIALIFFTSSILILFNLRVNTLVRNLLFVLFGIATILSHYSTAYITIIVLSFAYALFMGYKFICKAIFKEFTLPTQHLTILSLLILISAALFWNVHVTKSYQNITDTGDSVIKSIENVFSFDDKSSTILSFLFNRNLTYSNEELDKYIRDFSLSYKIKNNTDVLVDERSGLIEKLRFVDIYSNTKQGITQSLFLLPYTVAKYVILSGLIIGTLYLLFIERKNSYKFAKEYVLISIGFLSTLILVTVIPYLSVAYNIERLFQQSLVVTSACIVIGVMILFKKLKQYNIYVVAVISVIYYLYQSGITANLTGNVLRVNTYNYGVEYDAHYIHDNEIQAIKWMNRLHEEDYVYLDVLAEPKVQAYSGRPVNTIPYIFPNIIDKSGYVYSGNTNNYKNVAFIKDEINKNNSYLFVSFPMKYLNENKNLVYSNGGAKIFK